MKSTSINYKSIVEQLSEGKVPEDYDNIDDTAVLFAYAETYEQIEAISEQRELSFQTS